MCARRCLSHVGDEKRWAITNEQRSMNFSGTTVGSCVEITTRVARWRCCRTTVRSESVNREDAPSSDRYYD
jgi:hypothetical protein